MLVFGLSYTTCRVGQFLIHTIPESHSEKLLVVENPAGPSGNYIIVEGTHSLIG